jgi:hypothetical protein
METSVVRRHAQRLLWFASACAALFAVLGVATFVWWHVHAARPFLAPVATGVVENIRNDSNVVHLRNVALVLVRQRGELGIAFDSYITRAMDLLISACLVAALIIALCAIEARRFVRFTKQSQRDP